MVAAGFEATVAPLGTALTADQLTLMWKMADEPVLCFDGDAAGRRAAYRAVDIALPLLKPGKSLKFATLPEGRIRTISCARAAARRSAELIGARARSPRCCGRARPKPAPFDTPERRAALEARLGEITATIGDDTVRKYYRQDFGARLRKPARARGRAAAGGGAAALARPQAMSGAIDRGRTSAADAADRPRGVGSGPYVVASPQLAASPVHRGHRAAIPRREALILQVALNHPWLLHDQLEDLSAIEFRHAEAEKLKTAVVDIVAHDGAPDARRRACARNWPAAACGRAHARIEQAITTPSVWGARAEAGPEDVLIHLEAAHCLASAMAFLT